MAFAVPLSALRDVENGRLDKLTTDCTDSPSPLSIW